LECDISFSAGGWNMSQGAELEWSPGDKWNVIVEIPAGAVLEYKYVLLEGDGLRSIAWQSGNNSVLAVGHSDGNVEVFDNWESSPGASVLAAGEKTTREGRLLSWANEIESLFSSQVFLKAFLVFQLLEKMEEGALRGNGFGSLFSFEMVDQGSRGGIALHCQSTLCLPTTEI